MIASAKAAWGVAGIMAVALAGVGYQYASRSGNLSEQTASFENERNALQTRLIAIEKEAETLEGRFRDRESEFGQSQRQAAEREKASRGETGRLRTSLRDADRFLSEFRDALTTSNQRIEALQAQSASATERLKETESRLEETRIQLSHAESSLQSEGLRGVQSATSRGSVPGSRIRGNKNPVESCGVQSATSRGSAPRSRIRVRSESARGETGRLRTSLRDADRFLSEFRDALTTSNQRIEALQAQSASATERLKETESRLEETRIQLSHAESSLQQVEARLRDRESEFGQSQRQAAEREKASRGETGRLRTSLRDADRFLSEFRDALTTSNQRIEALQAQSASATERLKETESRLEETRIQLSHAESSLQQVEARLRDRESEFGQSQRQAAEREKASRGETGRLRTSLRDADRFLSEFRDALTTSNQRIEALQAQSASATERLKETESRLEETRIQLSHAESSLQQVEARLRDRESEFGQSQRQAAEREKASRGETGRLRTSLRDADRFLSEFRDALTTSNQRIEALQAQSASATERLKETESRLEETRIQLSHAESSLQQVEARLRDRESEFGQSQRQAAEREKASRGETGRLRTSLRDADRFLSEFRDALTTSNQRIEALQAQNVSATRAVVSLRVENRKLQEELKRFTREIQELSAVSQEAQSTRQSLQERIARLRERFEEAVRDKEREIEQLKASHELLLERLQSEIKKKEVAVRQEKEHISIEMVNRVTFETGRAELTESSKHILDVIYASLAPVKDGLIVIEGHADNRLIHGSLVEKFKSNWELSLARAAAVVRFLEGKGIDPKRMSVVGYSSFRPIDSNLTPAGRSRNRRVEILLVPGAGPATMKR